MTPRTKRLRGRPVILLLALVLSLFETRSAKSQPTQSDFQECSGKLSLAELSRCQELLSARMNSSSRTSPLAGGWRLINTADPRGGPDAISIIHASDTTRSDIDLAGLTFRCGPTGIETTVIVLEPLSHASRIPVVVKAGSNEQQFEASVIQGGEAVLLPAEASRTAATDWPNASELSVEIAIKPVPIRGVIPIAGLSGALQVLSQNCASRR